MTKEQANKFLYLVALFSFLTLLCTLFTGQYSLPILLKDKYYLAESIVFVVCQLLLIAAPFLKDNRYLFLMILVAYWSSFGESVEDFLGYLFTNEYHLTTIGIVPGWFSMGSFVFFDAIGLMALVLRCYGYIKEHRTGLKTQF